jgi:internalin A
VVREKILMKFSTRVTPRPWWVTRLSLLLLLVLFAVGRPAEAQALLSPSPGLTAAQVVANPELVHERLRSKNPDYRNQGELALDSALGLVGDFGKGGVQDLSPLQGIPFGALDLKGLRISNITVLKGMPLVFLGLEETQVADLKPLTGMKLRSLFLSNTAVVDLKPLAGQPLSDLMLVGTGVKDLRPLAKSPIKMLWLNGTPVEDISSLDKCPLVSLTLEGTPVSDLRPLAKMSSLKRLHIGGTKVKDLSPLKGLPLTRLIFSPKNITVGLETIRKMKTLTEIGTTLETRMPPKQFWQLYDQQRLH